MANPRPEEKPRQEEKSTQNPEDTIRRAGERSSEQTRRIGLAAAQAGEEVAQASSHLLQQNAEMLQNTWRHGVDMATAMMGRSTDQLGRTFGLTDDEAQRATERSARNAEAIMYSATAVAKGMNGVSREYFDFVRQQIESSMDRMNELWRCRTPLDLAAVHSDLVRDTISSALDTSRRMADMSLKVADDAGNHIAQSIERMKRAA
ncbi:phasin family protein [Bradyrhizobium sp. 186]|uniref:phasin family protein n=1 Tax=Bradyrhizobium sp. 186 TaxID=2782654 RepID=UPI002001BBB2|nr:phasin family protein [Bradyrhizobium sp. 186]UPK38958.1 phasin family protein [Bradyrhizobium sp. 186]